jgi:hypothetical protein
MKPSLDRLIDGASAQRRAAFAQAIKDRGGARL